MSAYFFSLGEIAENLIRMCICGDVVIFRITAQEAVSDATADEISPVATVT
jgi:hypothetical protein